MAEASVKTLRDVPIGQTATVRRLAGEGALTGRDEDGAWRDYV